MNLPMLLLLLSFVTTIVFQAIRSQHRLSIVLTGCAACTVIATSTGKITMLQLWKEVPWNVIAILVALGLFTQLVLPSNAMGVLALKATSFCKGRESRLLWVFPVMMFILSGTVNNLAAMNVILPVLLATLKILAPQQRYVDMLLAALLVACNLGGAATPIGDFPAILLMAHGGVEFTTYLVWAAPICVVILFLVLIAFLFLHGKKVPIQRPSLEETLAVATVSKLYRKTSIRWSILIPSIVVFIGMFACWIIGIEPDLVCIVGIAVLLLAAGDRGEKTIRTGIDVEPVVFLICLFIMIAAVTATGILDVLTQPILQLSSRPKLMLVVFLLAAGVLTGLFSAGPAMAALLPIATVLTKFLPSEPVYVGLSLAVCAGSSLFITAATSGVLAQE
jgi:Na+/H+ antiporter NhaD/arsenite permease-like protein